MIDIIVVNYRTPDDLDKFIESYRLYAPEEAMLTVVDVDPIVPYDYRKVKVPGQLIRCPNKGYAYACNEAASITTGDIIALFNADIILKEDTIQLCAKALRENPTWGACGPLQQDSKGKVTHGGILGTQSAPVQRGWHKRMSDEFREIRDDAVMVMGSAYFIRREVWEELTNCSIYQECFPGINGAFLPTFLYYEETGCSYHLASHGYLNVFYGAAECIHEWHGSIDKFGDNKAFTESQKIFRNFCDAHEISHD